MSRLHLQTMTDTRPVRRPHVVVYQVYGAVAWLVGGYTAAAAHALGRGLVARWTGGRLWGLGLNLGGLDLSPLASPGPGRTALITLGGMIAQLLLAALAWGGARRLAGVTSRLWLTAIGYSAALGSAAGLLADSLSRLPGGDARPLVAALGSFGHAWLLTPFALVFLLALIAPGGQGLVRMAADLHPPGSDGFGSWALAPVGPGLAVRCLWLAWAGWRLPERWGLWLLAFFWLLTLAGLSLVAYNWSRRLARRPRPLAGGAAGLAVTAGIGVVALVVLFILFGFSPATGGFRLLAEPPASLLEAQEAVAGNLAIDVDKSGNVRFNLDLSLLPVKDPLAARLAESARRPGAAQAFWQESAENLLRAALAGGEWKEIRPATPPASMWVNGDGTRPDRRFSGILPGPAASLTFALPAGGHLRLDDLAVSSAVPVTVIGMDAARQPAHKLPVAPGTTYHYSRSNDGSYFLPGADPPPPRLYFFRIQTP